MCLFLLAAIETDLNKNIQSAQCGALFLQYIAKIPAEIGGDLENWHDVRTRLQHLDMKSENADLLLRPFISEFQSNGTGPWTAVGFFLFWDSLAQIHNRLGIRDEPGVVFSQACWSLLKSLHRIDLQQRIARVGQKVINDTWHETRGCFGAERKNEKPQGGSHDNGDQIERIPSHYKEFCVAENFIERQWAIKRLRVLVHEGSLSRPDFQILLGCHLYGRSIDEMAIHLGTSYAVAKKRRQRAVKKLQKNAPHLSPQCPGQPPIPIRTNNQQGGRSCSKIAAVAKS